MADADGKDLRTHADTAAERRVLRRGDRSDGTCGDEMAGIVDDIVGTETLLFQDGISDPPPFAPARSIESGVLCSVWITTVEILELAHEVVDDKHSVRSPRLMSTPC